MRLFLVFIILNFSVPGLKAYGQNITAEELRQEALKFLGTRNARAMNNKAKKDDFRFGRKKQARKNLLAYPSQRGPRGVQGPRGFPGKKPDLSEISKMIQREISLLAQGKKVPKYGNLLQESQFLNLQLTTEKSSANTRLEASSEKFIKFDNPITFYKNEILVTNQDPYTKIQSIKSKHDGRLLVQANLILTVKIIKKRKKLKNRERLELDLVKYTADGTSVRQAVIQKFTQDFNFNSNVISINFQKIFELEHEEYFAFKILNHYKKWIAVEANLDLLFM